MDELRYTCFFQLYIFSNIFYLYRFFQLRVIINDLRSHQWGSLVEYIFQYVFLAGVDSRIYNITHEKYNNAMLLNILNDHVKPQHSRTEKPKQFSIFFQKIVNFIQWSELQDEILQKFEHILQIQLQINRDQLIQVLSHFKIDHELIRALMKMCEEIENNLLAFYDYDVNRCQDVQESSALNKVNLLIRTSTAEVKCLCLSLTFLHFASSNLDYYNRIIHWLEKKDIYNKLSTWNEEYSTVLKHKVLSVVSILYIKYGQIASKSEIIITAIKQRQKYLQYRNQLLMKNRSRNFINSKINQKSVVRFYEDQSEKLISLLSESILDDGPVKKSNTRRINNSNNSKLFHIKYETVSIYLRYKLVEGLINKKILAQEFVSDDQGKVIKNGQTAQKYYQILTLIHKFKTEVKAKTHISELKTQLQFFQNKTNQFLKICENNIKKFDNDLYLSDNNPIETQQKPVLFKTKSNVKKIGSEANLLQKKQSLSAKFRSGSLQISHHSYDNKKTLKQQLSQLYFKENQKVQKKREKTSSCKMLIRDRSKSKVMAKILSNTFQNAKNALRQIQFEIKTNNFQRFQTKKQKQSDPKSKLTKHKKTKQQIYEKLNKNNRIKSNVCKVSLLKEISQLQAIVISNPYTIVEENKKCIIQHKVSHKTQQQNQLLDNAVATLVEPDDGQNGISQAQSKIEFIKYLDRIPYKIILKIKPKDKNYLVQLIFNPPNESQFSIQMSLPKSNNIYTDRYHTIWPTIKYLLRKKMLQYPIMRQNQDRIFQTRLPQDQRHVIIKQEKLIELFGPIQEDQLFQISTTLSLICKFFNLLLYSKLEILGRKFQVSQFHKYYEIRDMNNLRSEQTLRKLGFQHSSQCIPNKLGMVFLNDLKRNMWLMNTNEIYIGSAIIKQRSCKFTCFQCKFQLPFYIFEVITNTGHNFRKFNDQKQLKLVIHIYPISTPEKRRNKQPKHNKKTKKYLHIQNIILHNFEIIQYQINIDRLTQQLNGTVNGNIIERQIQEKILQACWLRFSKFQDFYTPCFFDSYYPEICQPWVRRVDTDPSYKFVDFSNRNQPKYAVKIYQNILDFNVDDIFQNSFHLMKKQGTNQTLKLNKKAQAENRVLRMPSINTTVPGTNSTQKNKKVNCHLQINTIRSCLYKNSSPQEKQVIELNFLTPFKVGTNWILQISILNISKKIKNKIVLTAQDFYLLGYPYLQNEQDTLKQIQKLCKLLKVNRSVPIPKVVICLKYNESKNITTSSYTTHKSSRQGQQTNSIDRQNTKKKNQKYRSIYHNHAYKQDHVTNKNQLNKSTSQIYTQAYLKQNTPTLKRSPSSSSQESPIKTSTHNYTYKSLRSAQYLVSQSKLDHGRHHRSPKTYLIRMPEYKWHICTIPAKISIRNLAKLNGNSCMLKSSSRSTQNMFVLLHMNYINMSPSWQKQCGHIQFQLALNQIQYTLIHQIPQTQFFQLIKPTHPKLQTSMKNILSTLHTCEKQKEQDDKFEMKEKGRALKTFSLRDKKHIMGLIQLIYLHTTRQAQKSQQSIAIDLINNKTQHKQPPFNLTNQKSIIKQFLHNITLKQSHQITENHIINQHLTCSQCISVSSGFSNYTITINNSQFKLKTRVYHEYDPIKLCVYDIYLHMRDWRITAETDKIQDDHHLQLLKFEKAKRKRYKANKNTELHKSDNTGTNMQPNRQSNPKPNTSQSSNTNSLTNSISISNSNSNSNSHSNTISMSHQLSNISEQYIKQQQESLHQQYQQQFQQQQQIIAISLNQLIKQYREEQVDPVYQLKQEINRNTILLSKLVQFMMLIYVYNRGGKGKARGFGGNAQY